MNSKTSIVDEFLLKGLIGMSRATSKNSMSAHPAAAMLAAYFFVLRMPSQPKFRPKSMIS